METIKVSVVIPLYNKERQIKRAIHSVMAQTFGAFELLVINDGSTDEGPSLARDVQDERLKIIDQENMGVSSARNRGIAESSAGLVAFLDADDEWEEDFLETVMSLYEQYPACHVFATNYRYCDESGYISSPVINGLPVDFSQGNIEAYFGIAAVSDPIICTSAVMVRKDALERIGGFPEGIGMGEDLITWARLASLYRIAYSRKVCAVYHLQHNRWPVVGDFSIATNEFKTLLQAMTPNESEPFKKYVAKIHRGMAQTYLRNGQNDKARQTLRAGMSFTFPSVTVVLFYFLSFMPAIISKRLIERLVTANRFRRSIMFRSGKVN